MNFHVPSFRDRMTIAWRSLVSVLFGVFPQGTSPILNSEYPISLTSVKLYCTHLHSLQCIVSFPYFELYINTIIANPYRLTMCLFKPPTSPVR